MSGKLIKSHQTRLYKAFIGIFALSSVVLPINTRASVFSIFQTSYGASAPTTVSSQKMKILEAPMSPDLSAIGGGDIITDESALIPDGAPLPIDGQGVSSALGAKQTEPDAGSISTYKVQKGDSISEIAEKFDVSVNTILWANNMKKTDTIKVGETLVILPVTGVQYTVKKGDTISGIAKKFKADAAEVLSYNGFENGGDLVAGDKIIIPDGEIVVTPAPKKAVAIAPQITTPAITKTETTPEEPNGTDGAAPLTNTTGSGSVGGFIRPITEGIGRKSQGLHGFNGVDLAAPMGTPILAAASGTVIVSRDAGYNGGYGKYVVIQHEGKVQTLYAHMTKALAKVGETVEQGETIGLVGSTGKSTGPHVHYEVRGAKNNCAKVCQ